MKTIKIDSGFQRGGSLLSWNGDKFEVIRLVGENTWVSGGDSSFSTEVSDGFKGATTRFWGISPLSYCNSAELMGFSEEELSAPSPVRGWASAQGSCVRSTDDWRLDTMGDYLVALARGASIFTVEQAIERGEKHPSGNGKVLVRLNFEAGDQVAGAFAILDQDGNILSEVSGCGERTPRPVETEDGWSFTSDEEEWMNQRQAADCRLYQALDRGNSEKWVKVLMHLRASYKANCNPLPTLRKKYPGTWTYFRPDGMDSDADDNSVIFLQIEKLSESSQGWMVIYKPATAK